MDGDRLYIKKFDHGAELLVMKTSNRNSIFNDDVKMALIIFALLVGGILVGGCSNTDGQVAGSGSGSSGDGAGTLFVTHVNSKDATQWIADSSGVPYSQTTGVDFAGTCGRGVQKINVYLNGSVSAETSQGICDANGQFSVSVNFPAPSAVTE